MQLWTKTNTTNRPEDIDFYSKQTADSFTSYLPFLFIVIDRSNKD